MPLFETILWRYTFSRLLRSTRTAFCHGGVPNSGEVRAPPVEHLESRSLQKEVGRNFEKFHSTTNAATSCLRHVTDAVQTPSRNLVCTADRKTFSFKIRECVRVCVCVFSSHLFWTPSSLDVPAGVSQEEGHTGFLIHLRSAVACLYFSREGFKHSFPSSTVKSNFV